MATVGTSGSRRDAAVRRLRRVDRLVLAASVGLTVLFAGAAAETFKGRNEEHRAQKRGGAAGSRRSGPGKQPLQAPLRAPVSPVQKEELETLEREAREPPVVSGAS